MNLLNPYAFTPFGQPVAPGVNMLRAIGAPASAGQLDAARSVFSRFCSQTQLSAALNQTAIGRLPDGTRYKIAVVGAQTTMTLWPVAEKGRPMKPGIGVTSAGGRWILRPPGKELKPESGKWAVEEVKSIKGGEVYVFSEDEYFVEAPAGLSQNNERVADCIHGAPGSRYVWAANTFDVSSPFLASGAVKQLKIDGGALKLGERRVVDGVPDATLITSTHALPGMSAGDRWGMVSSNATGKSIVVCRTEADPDAPPEGKIGSRVCAVAHMKAEPPPKGAARPPNTLIEVTSVQPFAPVVTERSPDSNAGQSPQQSMWSRSDESSDTSGFVTIANPNPAAPNPTFQVESFSSIVRGGYEENSHFESLSTCRAYVGSAGLLVTDQLRRLDKATLSMAYDTSREGYEQDIWVDYTINGLLTRKVAVERSEEFLFCGAQTVKLYSMKIDYDFVADNGSSARTYFESYRYNSLGEIAGFYFGGVASAAKLTTETGQIERSSEAILVVDDQFEVVVTAKVRLEAKRSTNRGCPRVSGVDSHAEGMNTFERVVSWMRGTGGYPGTPVDEFEYSTKTTVSLEVLHGAARSSTVLAPPEGLEDRASEALGLLLHEISQIGSGRAVVPEDDPEATEGVRPNRFFREYGLTEVVDEVFSEQLGDVMYAKDPKTGAGFFSFVWAGKPYNYVVGPWGVAPSSSRTTIAKDAAISALQSV